MRKTAFLSTAAALLISVSPVAAQTDFDALLSDLTFGDSPSAGETLTLDVAAEKAAETLKPAPAEPKTTLTLPPEAEVVVAPSPTPESAPAATPEASRSIVQGPMAHAPITPTMAAPTPVAPTHIDFAQAFAAQECDACGGCDSACGGPCAGGCATDGCLLGGCGKKKDHDCPTCIPYHKASLPSSSFFQYFRSDACNVDVWNGFHNRCCYADHHSYHDKNKRGCMDCETIVYEASPCAARVCTVPSKTSAKRFFDFSKPTDCDDSSASCDSTPACDSPSGTCD